MQVSKKNIFMLIVTSFIFVKLEHYLKFSLMVYYECFVAKVLGYITVHAECASVLSKYITVKVEYSPLG